MWLLSSTETKQINVKKGSERGVERDRRCPMDLLRELENDIDKKRRDLEFAEFSMQVPSSQAISLSCDYMEYLIGGTKEEVSNVHNKENLTFAFQLALQKVIDKYGKCIKTNPERKSPCNAECSGLSQGASPSLEFTHLKLGTGVGAPSEVQ